MAGRWESLGLIDELVKAVEYDRDWMLPTAIQEECIPRILNGGDVLASAETGSGKTAAFTSPAIQICHELKGRQREQQHWQREKVVDRGESNATSTPLSFEMSTQDCDNSILFEMDPTTGSRIISRSKKEWAGVRCSIGVSSKKSLHERVYFECRILEAEGIVRIGYSTADASLNLGMDRLGWGYGGTDQK